MSGEKPLSDEEVAELVRLTADPYFETAANDAHALAREVQERRAEEREAAERVHVAREAAAGRPIAKFILEPVAAFRINPEPESGGATPTEGLDVFFDAKGNCGLAPVAFPDSRFTLSAAAARQLAEVILETGPTAWRVVTGDTREPPDGELVLAASYHGAAGWWQRAAIRTWWSGDGTQGSAGFVWESPCCDGMDLNDPRSPLIRWRPMPPDPVGGP